MLTLQVKLKRRKENSMKIMSSILFVVVFTLLALSSMVWIAIEVYIYDNTRLFFIPLVVVFISIGVYIIYVMFLPLYWKRKRHKKQPPTYYDDILNKAAMHRKRKRME